MGKTLITGAGGQLGIELTRCWGEVQAVPLTRYQLDITDSVHVEQAITEMKPSLIIHAAAATDVNRCEENRADAYKVNVVGTWNVARAAARVEAKMVYVGTNYVFDGLKLGPYLEYDDPSPLNAYGWTKLQGERAARQVVERLFIVRTSWLYSRWAPNFVSRLLDLEVGDIPLRYVGNQVANPTHAGDLAAAIFDLAQTDGFGIHHLVNEGATSWYGWAAAILEGMGRHDVELEEITADEFPRAAIVPGNSELANQTARAAGVTMRPWGEALSEHLQEMLA